MNTTLTYKGVLIASLVMLLAVPSITEAALPTGFSTEVVAGGLNLPTTFDFAPGNRIFVAEKAGTVRVIKDGQLLPTPFFTLPHVNTWADRGLIGLAVDPNFAQNGWVYLSYTYDNSPAVYDGPKMAQIVRVQADASGDVAIPSSLEVLVGSVVGDATTPSCNSFATGTDCIPSDSPSHSAGGLRFGPDGKLWATIGDGASFAFIDPNAYKAQDPDWLLGKVLRLNTDGTAPADNPFYDGDPTSNRSKVYALGIRNSFRFNFRPSNDSLYAGEVGWGGWEEINVIAPGVNYGWPCREGLGLQGGYQCTAPGAQDPLYTYANNGGASIVGGDFAGAAYPAPYEDSYFFGDFYRSTLSRMVISADDSTIISNDIWLDGNADGPVAINTAPDGSIYFAAIYTGEIKHLKYTGGTGQNQAPTARDDDATALQDQVTYISLLSNDTDPEDDPLTLGALTTPTHGVVYNNGDNTVTYVPATGFTGTDQFSYTVSDSGGLTDTATVTIDVRPYGDPTLVNITHLSLTQDIQTPVLGETVTFTATVRNDGQAGSFLVDFELYNAATQALTNSKVFTNEYIDAGQTRTFTWSWTPQSEGDYWLSVGYLSPDWSLLHHWEDKGLQFTVLPRKPTAPAELVIDSITVSDPAVVLGDPVSATVTIRNIGGAGSGLVAIEVTDDTATGVHSDFFDNEPFTVGEVRTFTTTWTPTSLGTFYVDAGTFGPGWYPFQHWAWHGAQFTVSDTVSGPPPDLVINGITIDNPTPTLGDTVMATVTITNNGGDGTGLVAIEVTDATATGVHSDFFDNELFAAGETRTFTTTWTPTSLGTFYVDAGTFGPGWYPFQHWAWHGAQFTVSDTVSGPAPVVVYDDALSTEWSSWSWDTSLDFASTKDIFAGSNATEVTYAAPWGGAYFRAKTPFTKQNLTTLAFAINGNGASGQTLRIKFIDPNGVIVYQEDLPPLITGWDQLSIPLGSISDTDIIAGVYIMGRTGQIEAPYLIDELQFE